MALSRCWTNLSSWALLSTALAAQVSLADLPALARGRAERERPLQEAALQPFWADLSLDYRTNQDFLDKRMSQIAKLGDSIVPLLLEKLQPTNSSEPARFTASNCRRVLAQLDPASFLDALWELANGRSPTAREQAIRLLGYADTPRAADALVDLWQRTEGQEQRLVLASLTRREASKAAPLVVPLLASTDRQLREEALQFLVASKPSDVASTVADAMLQDRDQRLLTLYIQYFAAAVQSQDVVARALLKVLDREDIDWQDMRAIVQCLATVAPKNHQATISRLDRMLATDEPTSIVVEAAVTMRALGEKQGTSKLHRQLSELLRRPNRRRDATLLELRANLQFAVAEYGDAATDYEDMLQDNSSLSLTRRAYVGLIRCYAHLRKSTLAIKHMDNSGMLVSELAELASQDEATRVLFEQDKVRNFLQQLAKKQAPR